MAINMALRYTNRNIEMNNGTLFDIIQKSEDFNPQNIALQYFGIKIPYADFFSNIENNRQALSANGIKQGDIIAMSLPSTPESICLFYAANALGAIVQWIDVRSTPSEIDYALKISKAKLLFIMAFNIKRTPPLKNLPCEQVVVLRGCDSLPNYIQFWYKTSEHFNGRKRQVQNKGYISYSEFITTKHTCSTSTTPPSNPDSIAAIFPTSGTTGSPKYVKLTNRAINFMISSAKLINPQHGDIWLTTIPCFTATGLIWNIHCPLSKGMTIHVIPYMNPKSFSNILLKVHPNHICSVPSYWKFILSSNTKKQKDLSFIKTIFICGERLSDNFEKKINEYLTAHGMRYPLIIAYGMTESACAGTQKSKYSAHSIGSVGHPYPPEVSIKIINDNRQELPNYQKGEICLHTPFPSLGYFNNDKETAELLQQHIDGKTWIHTGDIGYKNDEGELFVIDRKKRMIVLESGTKIFPSKIEKEILSHIGLKNCAVVGIKKTDNWVDELIAYVVIDKSCPSSRKSIMRFCKAQLQAYSVPTNVKFVNELPHTSSGKINYDKLIEKNIK